jgi:hypothetical protein
LDAARRCAGGPKPARLGAGIIGAAGTREFWKDIDSPALDEHEEGGGSAMVTTLDIQTLEELTTKPSGTAMAWWNDPTALVIIEAAKKSLDEEDADEEDDDADESFDGEDEDSDEFGEGDEFEDEDDEFEEEFEDDEEFGEDLDDDEDDEDF